ncbi:MFS transporter [Vallitalea longa]|uniref:MFS transporter n=1 Tax=Vallitalea longa TaxID=2936439 RepID=A0A9W6DI44_9FIRM|nr:MFS transporter [Vallitalea longa]GKX31519.1 MFS transporter [Vallitalea longa]
MGNSNYREKKDLVLIMISTVISSFGDYIFDIGVLIYLYKLTNSPMVIGGFLLSQLLPSVVYLFVSGLIIDSFDRKKVIICINICRFFILLLLLFNQSIYFIYLITFILGVLDDFARTLNHTLIPSLFDKEYLLKVNSSLSLLDSISIMVSPVLVTLIVGKTGFAGIVIINAFTFLIISFIYLFIKYREDSTFRPTGRKNLIKTVKLGIKEISHNTFIQKTLVSWSFFMLGIGLSSTLLIFVITEKIGLAEEFYGYVTMAEGVGMFIGSFLVLKKNRKIQTKLLVTTGLIISCVSYLLIGYSTIVLTIMVGSILVGLAASFCPLGFRTSIQTEIEEKFLGQTFIIIRFVVIMLRSLGVYLSGMLVQFMDIPYVYLLASIVTLVSVLLYVRGKKQIDVV